jgi:hypothetical protein
MINLIRELRLEKDASSLVNLTFVKFQKKMALVARHIVNIVFFVHPHMTKFFISINAVCGL